MAEANINDVSDSDLETTQWTICSECHPLSDTEVYRASSCDEKDLQITTLINEELLEEAVKTMKKRSEQFTLIAIGKPGVGKSRLSNSILKLIGAERLNNPISKEGMMSVTSTIKDYKFQTNETMFIMVDTPGLFCPEMKKKTEEEVISRIQNDVFANDSNGMLLVCIPLYERLDNSMIDLIKLVCNTMAVSGMLYGKDTAKKSVMIALTKADSFPEEWLKDKPKGIKKSVYMKEKFEKAVHEAKD